MMKKYKNILSAALLSAAMFFSYAGAHAQVKVGGNVFGGGNLASVGHGTTVLVNQTGAIITGDVYGGGALAKVDTAISPLTPVALRATFDPAKDSVRVTLLAGTLGGNVYGGGLGDSTAAGYGGSANVAAHVYGPVHVSIGNSGGGSAVFSTAAGKGMVFGGNNLNGSPMDNVRVDIWSTAHGSSYAGNQAPTGDGIKGLAAPTDEFTIADVTANSATQTYALQAVYGGGNKASYTPVADKSATVHIHTCANTVKDVYGGGNAADVGTTGDGSVSANTDLTIDGGRFYRVFGGGNGEGADNPGANIYGTATTTINGGLIDTLFGGSNSKGDITTVSLTLENDGSCDEAIVSLFGGANESNIQSNVELTIGCGAGIFDELYGGSNKADIINGNVTLNVRGGTIGSVYGGSKGTNDRAANISGNVTLNLYGGTITNAFGGSNINGNITGLITVNVLDREQENCALDVTNIYGGGNLTPYTPTYSVAEGENRITPVVNLVHIAQVQGVRGNVYGGAKGASATVTANPRVNFGYASGMTLPSGYPSTSRRAYVSGNVFGGGDAAPVEGNTLVLVQNANSRAAEVFGGGNNIGDNKGVSGTATVTMSAGTVTAGLYGGCNENGIVDGDIFVTVTGGTVGTDDGVSTDGVFGGGYGPGTSTKGKVNLSINGSSVNIYGDVYGGSAKGHVGNDATDSTTVTLTSGTIHGDLYGGGLGDATHAASVEGAVTVTVAGGSVDNVFGCNNANGAPMSTVQVDIKGGTVSQNVYGGGNLAAATLSPVVTVEGGTVSGNVFGGGNQAGVGAATGTTLVVVRGGSVLSGVYGGCNTSGTVDGDIIVNISGGVIGTENNTTADVVFGGGFGNSTSTTGDVTLTINKTGTIPPAIWGNVYGGSAKGHVNDAATDNTTITLTSGTIHGDLYGGGLGDATYAATVKGAVTVNVEGGSVTDVFGCNNLNGAPQAAVTVNIGGGTLTRVFGGGNQAAYAGTPDVNISGGTTRNVYGGGNEAGVEGTDVTISDGTVTTGIYGGCNTEGTVTGNTLVSLNGGTVGSESIKAGAFGGGYGQQTGVNGNVQILLNGATVYGDIYGGSALGSVNSNSSNTTIVDILSGTLSGDAYGGGLGQAGNQSIAALVNGVVTVNVGRNNGGTYEGSAHLEGANIYGCNNVYGSPQTDVYVNVYGTAHDSKNIATYGNSDGEGDATYAIKQVFGGGNRATYAPENGDPSSKKTTHVHIFGCDNTIEEVYGGSNAADAQGVHTVVDGGRFRYIFGGGNGLASAADVYDTTYSRVNGGHVEFYFGGSNRLGNCERIDAGTGSGSCGKAVIDVLFNGGNMADVYAENLTLNLTCDSNKTYKSVYGGCRLGSVYGNITINISGGTFSNVYGGCRGALGNNPFAANVRRFPTEEEINNASAGTYVDTMLHWLTLHPTMYGQGGNITINLTGGDIGRVYGGCDLNGNVEGTITINVDSTQEGTCALDLDYIYGGGDIAQYHPEDSTITSPLINLINGHVNHDVFGGGHGADKDDATDHIEAVTAGLVTSNPKVEMNPAAGKNFWVKGNIYGGGEMASVGVFTRNDGQPTACNLNTGTTTVEILGGKVGPSTLTMPKDSGMVFGGGKGLIGGSDTKAPYLAYNNVSHVIIGKEDHSSGPLIKGSVYGGSQNGHVLDSTYVKIQGGQIGCGKNVTEAYAESVFTNLTPSTDLECPSWTYASPYAPYDKYAQENYKYDNATKDTTYGGLPTGSDGHTFYGNVFGGGSGYFPYAAGQWLESAGVVYGNTRVEISGGHILTSVYGGNELTDVRGTASVVMTGGTLGVPRTEEQIAAHPVTCYLFGGGKGDQRSRFATWTNVDSAYVKVSGGTIYGSVFGGAEDGHVKRNVKMEIAGGTIGTRGISYVDGNIFGAGRGFSGEVVTEGLVLGNIEVDITGGTMLGSIYGGGRLASVGLNTSGQMQSGTDHGHIIVNISGGTIGNDVANAQYGGNVFAGSMGRLTKLDGTTKNPHWPGLAQAKRTEVTISGSAHIKKNVYGGGEIGFVRDSAIVNISGGTVAGTVYGGGYGSNDDEVFKHDSVTFDRPASMLTAAFLAGRVYGHTLVNVTDGTVSGDIYGGGERASVGDSRHSTSGSTTVNIGRNNNGTYEGNATIRGNVYGANNLAGSPFGNARVNIYKTNRTAAQETSGTEYAIVKVFGGGHEADYAPKSTASRAYVHVYGCQNTIKNLFGGGDAAAVYGAKDTIDGGRFHFIFGGGNGETAAADIGAGGTGLVVQGGIIDSLFGGSNIQGSINGPVSTALNHNSNCSEQIGVFFAGSNKADINQSLVTNIDCGVETITEIYGGCHLADIKGDVTLNIKGGSFTRVFAGSKGRTGDTSADSANISGNVTLNIHGGTIDTAFGGSNVNGNIGGLITVNIEDTSNTCQLQLAQVYGGGKDAAYTPTTATLPSPLVNIKHIRRSGGISGNVNGGGLGSTATVTANPVVTIGDQVAGHSAVVTGDVFGGGEKAEVHGTTKVVMQNAHSSVGYIFGGGDQANVSGATTVRLLGGTVKHDVYGGGALSTTGGSYVALNGATVTDDLYGGGKGDNVTPADVGGSVMVMDSAGTVTNIYGCNNLNGSPTGTVNVYLRGGTVSGNVYGGGNLADAKYVDENHATHSTVTISSGSAQNVFGGGHAAHAGYSTVNVSGGTIAKGVYGGCESSGDVNFDAIVNLTGGTIGASGSLANRADGVFGGGLGEGTNVIGNVTVNLNGATVYGDLYGGSSLGKVNTYGSSRTFVNILSGTILGDVYGGGFGRLADPGNSITAAEADVNGKVHVTVGTIDASGDYIGGASISSYDDNGAALISAYRSGTPKGGSVYGCNNVNGTPKDSVYVTIYGVQAVGGADVSDTDAVYTNEKFALDQVFGGGNKSSYAPQSNQAVVTHIFGCDNTIRRVFGGSNASHATRVHLIIDGGRYGDVYAGGNGEVEQANVTDYLFLGRHGGKFGGFTNQGNNLSNVPTGTNYVSDLDGDSCGTTNIYDMFCGNNDGPSNNNIVRTITCGENVKVRNLYGGCNKGHQNGNIDVVVEGGEIDNVFGGCKGTPETPANVYGHINLTIKGGTIKNVYGGCDVNGNVTGKITVNVLDNEDGTCVLNLTNVYGGGRNAHYQPTTAGLYPEVNIQHIKSGKSIAGNVYGGGYGEDAFVQSDPVVNIGDLTEASRIATVSGSVYGGGESAEVRGNTTVNILKVNTQTGTVYGGGNKANVTGNVDVVIGNSDNGPTINGDVYGGGALAHTGTSGNTSSSYHNKVTLNNGTVSGNVYGGGLGKEGTPAYVYGPVQVIVNGGTADSVFGCNNVKGAPQSTVAVDVYGCDTLGAVFGGGNLAAATVAPTVKIHNSTPKIGTVYGGGNAAEVSATEVTVYGGTIDSVFGGGNGKVSLAPVNGTSTVKIHGGTVKNVFGGNNTSGNIDGTIGVTIESEGESADPIPMAVGNVYGGGNLAVYEPTAEAAKGKDHFSPTVTIKSGTINGTVYGGGKGIESSLTAGLVKTNTLVDMRGGTVIHSIYGGGELASVGDINFNSLTCISGTGLTKVLISGGVVGDVDNARMPSNTNPDGDDYGYVFCGGKGIVDTVTYTNANRLAIVDSTYLEISGTALITASVYGGCENGLTLRNTQVKIAGGQIGTGHYTTQEGNTVTHHWDAAYTDAQWAAAKAAVTSGNMDNYTNPFHECDHFPYGDVNNEYNVYDIFAGDEDYNPAGASKVGANGHSFYGNVFGGGSGFYPFWDATNKKAVWRRTAGQVRGNTLVEITGGHILTSVYGGNEITDVLGHCTVKMSGGTLGVPRSLDAIAAHPVTCYLFGAGMGDPRADFGTWTSVDSVYVEVSGGIIYGSIFGGGEDGHVKGNVYVVVKDSAFIGTWGTSYVDGNVFGGGRGFRGNELTPGIVAGNVKVDIQGGTMLGSVYGGGRLASVGTYLALSSDNNYGKMQDGESHGNITVSVTGGTIGNNYEFEYVESGTLIDTAWRASNHLPLTEYDANNILYHTKGGNVFGGSMGRLTLLNNATNPLWSRLAMAKATHVNISGDAVIKGSVYGGSELGTVTGDATVTVSGGTIGTPIDSAGKTIYHYGGVYGGGYGSDNLTTVHVVDSAGRVFGTATVTVKDSAKVQGSVFGGGDLASVTGNTTVTVTGGAVGPIDSLHLGGNVYGAGKGKPSEDYKLYSNVASTTVTIKGGTIKGDVYGGGADAHVLGHTSVTINSEANIGTEGLSDYDGNVFGGGRGSGIRKDPNDRSTFTLNKTCGRVGGNTNVTMTAGTLQGSIFGGGRMALVGVDSVGTLNKFFVSGSYDSVNHGMATVTVSGGHIGNPDGDALLESDYSIGNIFGSGKGDGVDSNDVLAGRVMNTKVTISGNARIYGAVFGGGEMAGIGWWDTEGDNKGVFYAKTGTATVAIDGCDTIGTKREFETDYLAAAGDWTDMANGRLVHSCTGNVVGGSQGDASVTPYEGTEIHKKHWVSMGRSRTATVTIGGGHILGNVYGGAEQGTVTGNTTVTVKGGTIGTVIGSDDAAYNFGSVYGGGYGSDETDATNDSSMAAGMVAGRVYGSTRVDIQGGHIYNNVYGGGSMANVGWVNNDPAAAPVQHTDAATTAAISWPWDFDYYNPGHGYAQVNITGGRIGGDVYGASRGMAGDRYQMAIFGSLVGTQVNINYTNPSDINGDNVIVGSVYGGGENGHVYDTAIVTLRKGLVGGSLYGAGRGVDTYIDTLKNTATDAKEAVTVRDISAGKVYGNTLVTMYGGQVLKNVYGGGEMASVGKGNYHGYGETDSDSAAHRAGSGKAIVRIYGGTVGKDGTDNGHVYGSSKGITFVNVTKTPRIDYSRDFFLGYVNTTDVTIGKADTTYSTTGRPRIYGNVFGGGENGHVRYDTRVTVNDGVIGVELDTNLTKGKTSAQNDSLINTLLWANRGNVFGAGRGTDFIPGTSDYCVSAGSVTCSTQVDINGGTIYRNVYGGGDMASVGPPPTYKDPSVCIVNIRASLPRSTAYKEYGGYVGGGSRGLANADDGPSYASFANCANTVVNLSAGAWLNNSVFGGCEYGQVSGKAQVNVDSGSVNTIYCGGNGRQGETGYVNDTVSGRVGTTELNLLSGSVNFVYGGGRHANVSGNATVNVGRDNGDGTYYGEIKFSGRSSKVFGCNRYVGSPKGNVYVNVYKTAHVDTNSADYQGANAAYAIPYVFGGGSEADYKPNSDTNRIYLTVYTCDNTIGNVFGGGDAAAVTKTTTVINGGRMGRVFAGGNGENKAADVGDAILTVKGGRIGQLFGGSNQRGNVAHVNVTVKKDGDCPEEIDEFFGGSSEADLEGDIVSTIDCGAKFKKVYGGSNKADIKGNVTLNILGGTIDTVFGGSKGQAGTASADSANITGNVTLNLHGGKITTAFGGSNINGNITGGITVNVVDTSSCMPLLVTDIFGAGNLTPYTPSDTSASRLLVNVKHTRTDTTIAGNVYGGGLGLAAIVSSNPVVTIGDISHENYCAIVAGNVYGGGNAAAVQGKTTVLMQKSNSSVSELFGGGKAADVTRSTSVTLADGKVGMGIFGGCDSAGVVFGGATVALLGGTVNTGFGVFGGGYGQHTAVEGNVAVTLDGATVNSEIYGGSALGSINTDANNTTTVRIKSGQVGSTETSYNVYGGGQGQDPGDGDIAAEVKGAINVYVEGGTVFGSVYGCNNNRGDPQSTVAVTMTGGKVRDVIGGGNIAAYRGTPVINISGGEVTGQVVGGGNAANVGGTQITIAGGSIATGDGYNRGVYGGCNADSNVNGDVVLSITGGTIGTENNPSNVFGGGYGESTRTYGDVDVSINTTGTIYGDVYGGSALGFVNDHVSNTSRHTHVTLTRGTIAGNLYGGGLGRVATNELAAAQAKVCGLVKVQIDGGTVQGSVFGCNNIHGAPQIDTGVVVNLTDGSVGGLFGGGNKAGYGGTPRVTISGGTVTGNVFGGGNDITNPYGVGGSDVRMTGGTVDKDLYGGCNAQGTVSGNAQVTLTAGTVHGSVYGGGLGKDTRVAGKATVDISGSTAVGIDVYGGGNEGQVTGGADVIVH